MWEYIHYFSKYMGTFINISMYIAAQSFHPKQNPRELPLINET